MSKGTVNKVILIGNVGGDPVSRFLPNGNAVTSITLATGDSWRDKQSGQMQERTEWHRVTFFGKIAEIATQYLRKGSKVYVEGKLQTREWEKDGVKRYTTEIIVDMNGSMQMLDGRAEGGDRPTQQRQQGQQGNQQRSQSAPAQQPRQAPVADAYAHQNQQPNTNDYNFQNDDIPFANPYRGRLGLLV